MPRKLSAVAEGKAQRASLVELAIRDRFPGDDEAEHRIALLRIHHAAERAQWDLDTVGRAMADYLRDPEPIYSAGILTGAAAGLATRLVSFAAELRKSSDRILDASRRSYLKAGR